MSATVDNVIQRYILDDKYSAKAAKVQSATHGIASAVRGAIANVFSLNSVLGKAVGVAKGVGMAIAATVVTLVGLGGYAIKTAGDIQALRMALEAVEGSTEAADKAFERMKARAFERGLGLESLISGYVGLRGARFEAELAERAVLAFGNAVKATGGGNMELEAVLTNVKQIGAAAMLTGDEVREMAAYLPSIRSLLADLYGGSDADHLKGHSGKEVIAALTAELEKMKIVSGGIKTVIANIQTVAVLAFSEIGNVLAEWLMPKVELLTSFLQYLVQSGIIREITNGFVDLLNLGDVDTPLINALAWTIATLKNLPGIVRAVFNYVGSSVQKVANNIGAALRIAFEIFMTVALVRGIITVAIAMVQLARAIKAVATGMALVEALTVGGLAAIALALVAWGIVVKLTDEAFNRATEGIGNIGDGIRNLPEFKQIEVDANAIKEGFKGYTLEHKSEDEKNGVGTPLTNPVANAIQETAKNTDKIARNTEEQLDLSRYALGGGDIARFAVTPVERRRIRGGNVNINVTGADESLNKLLTQLLRRALPMVSRVIE